jgi:hypothetical protein
MDPLYALHDLKAPLVVTILLSFGMIFLELDEDRLIEDHFIRG